MLDKKSLCKNQFGKSIREIGGNRPSRDGFILAK
jgi:hypothetical protein